MSRREYGSSRDVAFAHIEYTEEENDYGVEVECVYAKCTRSSYSVGPIWGHSSASVKRALATLTGECDCGAGFHDVDA